MNAWSNLPNAKHIDWVLDSLKSNIDIWNQAWNQANDQARYQAWNQAWNQAYDQARVKAYNQARDQSRGQAYEQASDQAWNQVYGVLLALIAYDDCDQYLSMTFDELKTWALISENSQAILLLPMKYVKEKLNECLV